MRSLPLLLLALPTLAQTVPRSKQRPVCFSFAHQNDAHGDCDPHDVPVYPDANGIQHSFQVDPDVIATFRMDGSVPLGCAAATPATPVTWGQIRAQYR